MCIRDRSWSVQVFRVDNAITSTDGLWAMPDTKAPVMPTGTEMTVYNVVFTNTSSSDILIESGASVSLIHQGVEDYKATLSSHCLLYTSRCVSETGLTHTGVLARLGPQTDDDVTWQDLTALPCSHPHCCSVGYLLRDDSGSWRSLTSLVGHDRLKEFLDLNPDLIANRIADSNINQALKDSVKQSLLDLLSEQSSLSHPSIGSLWKDICVGCDLGIGTLTQLATSALPGQHKRLRSFLGERGKRCLLYTSRCV